MLRLFPINRSGLLVLCMALLLAALSPEALAAARPFSIRYTTNTNGNMTQIGNTIMTCSACAAWNNSAGLIMSNFDGDTDSSTFNSSSADLTIPSGSTVLWAGLYWGARSASANIGQVLFKTPSSFGYNAVNANQLDTGVGGQGNEYGGFADVTSLVSSGGSGTYWVGNIQTTGGNSQWGGWSLIVAYANNNELLNNITVFDGYQVISSAAGVTMNVSGFLTPLSGPVISRVGLIGWDGDDGVGGGQFTGDQFQVNGVSLYDNCNPSSNDFFNSTICNLGVPNEARYPNTATYPAGMINTLGVDVDLVQLASGIIPNGATSATLNFTTNGESFGAHAAAFVTNLYVPIVTPNVVKDRDRPERRQSGDRRHAALHHLAEQHRSGHRNQCDPDGQHPRLHHLCPQQPEHSERPERGYKDRCQRRRPGGICFQRYASCGIPSRNRRQCHQRRESALLQSASGADFAHLRCDRQQQHTDRHLDQQLGGHFVAGPDPAGQHLHHHPAPPRRLMY